MGRLCRSQTVVPDISSDLHGGKHPTCSASRESCSTLHPEDCARFWSGERSLFRQWYGCRPHPSKRKGICDVHRTIGAAAGTSAGTLAWWCHLWERKLAMDLRVLRLVTIFICKLRFADPGVALSCAALYVVLLFCLPETLRSVVGSGAIYVDKPLILAPRWKQATAVDPKEYPKPPPPTLLSLLKLLQYPPIVIVSLNSALLFAAYYAINVTYSRFLADDYGFSTTAIGCAYLAPGLSLVAGSVISGRVSDHHRSLFVKNNPEHPPHPEHRLHLQIPGVLISLSGVLMYGWFVHFHIHASSVIVAASIAAFGMTWVFITTTSYLTESFKNTPATLVALASLFRNPAAAVAAVVIDPLIVRMGIGWCFTGLAFVELACVGSVAFLMVVGKGMRDRLDSKDISKK